MQYRRFGSTGLTVSKVGFGCARIGGVFQGGSRAGILKLLRRAVDEGITFFDTADMYTQGESERVLGEAFERERDRVIIATKVGFTLPAQKQLIARMKPFVRPLVSRLGLGSQRIHASLRGSVSNQDFSGAYIAKAIEASLKRLKTDYIDVYQLHSPPLEVLQRGEFVETLETLREQGKLRYWGVACEQYQDVLACLQYPKLASVQVGISVLEQAGLDSAIPNAAQRGAAVIGRQVFASGLLTRQITSIRVADLDPDPGIAERKGQQLEQYASIAARCGRDRAEMALKFSVGLDDLSVVLVGISRDDQLESTMRALSAPELTQEELQLLMACRRPGQ